MSSTITSITIDTNDARAPTRGGVPGKLSDAFEPKRHPTKAGGENATLSFIGTATTLIQWKGITIMTDPNFLHAGDHVHLGPGVTGKRRTNPAIDLHDLPAIHLVLLSHYHEDHFDRMVEDALRRDLPIVTTPHAHKELSSKSPPFEKVTALDVWQAADILAKPNDGKIKVTAMPGKHVPPGPLKAINDFIGAVPPTNGWMVELAADREKPYRIYMSGDTLLIDELKEIPKHFPNVDLMLIHLGGTSIPGPNFPLLMVTMDAKQGIQLVHLIHPDITIPIHYDDYDVFKSPLKDFQTEVTNAGLDKEVVYLDRGEQYCFVV